MAVEDNKQLVRRLFEEAINGKKPDVLDEILAPDVVSNTPFPEGKSGLDGFKEVFAAVISSFPDYQITIDDQIGEGDKVVTRYTATGTQEGAFLGVPPTGQRVELMGIDIDRISDGKIVEHWSEASVEDFLIKRGVIIPR